MSSNYRRTLIVEVFVESRKSCRLHFCKFSYNRTTSSSNDHRLSWKWYDCRGYDMARTDDHLPRAAGYHRIGNRWTVRSRDCGCAWLLGLVDVQMRLPWTTLGTHQPQFQHWPAATRPLSTLATGMRDAILNLRQTLPGWGLNTLLAEL